VKRKALRLDKGQMVKRLCPATHASNQKALPLEIEEVDYGE
jgi:hypothetical protein